MSMLGSTGGSFIAPAQIGDIVGRVGGSTILTGSLKSFNDEMLQLLADYSDPNKDMVLMGQLVKAADKYGTAATALFNFRLEEINSITTGLNNVYFNLVNLEKRLNV